MKTIWVRPVLAGFLALALFASARAQEQEPAGEGRKLFETKSFAVDEMRGARDYANHEHRRGKKSEEKKQDSKRSAGSREGESLCGVSTEILSLGLAGTPGAFAQTAQDDGVPRPPGVPRPKDPVPDEGSVQRQRQIGFLLKYLQDLYMRLCYALSQHPRDPKPPHSEWLTDRIREAEQMLRDRGVSEAEIEKARKCPKYWDK